MIIKLFVWYMCFPGWALKNFQRILLGLTFYSVLKVLSFFPFLKRPTLVLLLEHPVLGTSLHHIWHILFIIRIIRHILYIPNILDKRYGGVTLCYTIFNWVILDLQLWVLFRKIMHAEDCGGFFISFPNGFTDMSGDM